jgi:hypothetical protein
MQYSNASPPYAAAWPPGQANTQHLQDRKTVPEQWRGNEAPDSTGKCNTATSAENAPFQNPAPCWEKSPNGTVLSPRPKIPSDILPLTRPLVDIKTFGLCALFDNLGGVRTGTGTSPADFRHVQMGLPVSHKTGIGLPSYESQDFRRFL